ncbi:MAG: hypothetical protein MH204_09310 [Fimbriimonadaceae bacterium]|nr:hypothetical protein [Fimbriimonadaceae bacterium]
MSENGNRALSKNTTEKEKEQDASRKKILGPIEIDWLERPPGYRPGYADIDLGEVARQVRLQKEAAGK